MRCGEKGVLDKAAWQFADAVGIMLGHLVEAIAFYAISMGVTKGVGALRNTRSGRRSAKARQVGGCRSASNE